MRPMLVVTTLDYQVMKAITAMLGVLSMAPRVTGDAAAIAKFKALDKSSFTSTTSNDSDFIMKQIASSFQAKLVTLCRSQARSL